MFVSQSARPSVSQPAMLSAYLSIYLFVLASVCLSFYLSVPPSVRPSVQQFVYLYVSLSLCPSICLSVRPSIILLITHSYISSIYSQRYLHDASQKMPVPEDEVVTSHARHRNLSSSTGSHDFEYLSTSSVSSPSHEMPHDSFDGELCPLIGQSTPLAIFT